MSFKKSSSTTEKNKETWRKNLVQFQAPSRRGNVAIHKEPLSDRSRMPLKSHVMGRFKSLESIAKERKERVGLIADDIELPPVSDQAIRAKLEKLLQEYDHCRKKQNFDSLNELFDVTKVEGQWLCKEDKNLYELQMQSKGQVGYSTGKRASAQTIHPSKRRNTLEMDVSNSANESSSVVLDSSETGTDSCDTSEDSSMEDEAAPSTSTRKYNPTGAARRLVTSSKLSTHKAAKVCRQLSGEGIEIRTPTLYRRAAEVKQHLVSTLHREKWSLHFDGKKINGIEHQAVVLKNEAKEIKLTVLQLKDGVQLVGINSDDNCRHDKRQHHVLYRILRIVMDDELHDSTKSPDIEYFLVKDLVRMYDQLKAAFSNGKAEIKETGGWRDDMKFLYHLTRVFRHFTEKDEVPFVNFQQIPNISNARWNSRAILALLAFILMPETRTRLRKICSFISYPWAGHWFSNQLFRDEDFEELSSALDGYPKGLKCLETYWKRDESPINIARSNQCCERAIKVMQDLDESCRNKDNLPLRFVLSNDINVTN
ncbi:Uncharacterized protein FKW44_024153 [Caligus rogercresseyi]|uniref:Uncharacterized protein n=1 Tax=Caligus rogercresseyi TaxID=217165 RepID=A0A7T8GME6_CALRO|nr:Uncharacterized protein FKW44_024153 [Caligus rogercresseyi]